MHDEEVGHRRDLRYRREVADRIVRHFLVEHGVDGKRRPGNHERVAVGRRFGDERNADHLAGAGPVVDDHLLPPALRQLDRELSRDDVRAAAGRGRHDQPYRPVRIILRRFRRERLRQR